MKDSQLEDIFTSARDALSNFVISLPAHEQPLIVQEFTLPFLKNLEAIRSYCDRNPTGNPEGQEEEDDTETIVNGSNNAAGENPEGQECNNTAGENPEGQEDNSGDNYPDFVPCTSPRNSLTLSKSLKI